jgi:hypothetical protein
MKKKLVFVGNKPPMRDGLGKEIDSFDYVIRINRMNYLGYAGNRIDGLCLEANDHFKYLCKGGENKKYIKKAGQVFIRPKWYEKFLNWNDYLTREQFKNIIVFEDQFAIKETSFERLTTSILFIGYLLNSHWKDEYDIYITCLDIEKRSRLIDNHPNWEYHKGAGLYEQEFLMSKINSKQIFRLEDE